VTANSDKTGEKCHVDFSGLSEDLHDVISSASELPSDPLAAGVHIVWWVSEVSEAETRVARGPAAAT
jgi:hypothetical protein